MTPIKIDRMFSGRYKIRAINTETGVVGESAEFSNILLNGYFDAALAGTQIRVGGFAAGTGSSEPDVTNSGPDSMLGGYASTIMSSSVETLVGGVPGYKKTTIVARGSTGSIVGNVSEIVMYANFGIPIPGPNPIAVSRALVRDPMGNPTSITVLSDETLEVEWTLFSYLATDSGILEVNERGTPTTYDYEIGPAGMMASDLDVSENNSLDISYAIRTQSSATRLASKLTESGAFIAPGSTSRPAVGPLTSQFNGVRYGPYVPGSAVRTITLLAGLDRGNYAGGVRTFEIFIGSTTTAAVAMSARYRMILDRPLMKTSEDVFELPVVLSLANAPPPEGV